MNWLFFTNLTNMKKRGGKKTLSPSFEEYYDPVMA